uniref:Calmodulin-lysine N-methyltransferase n=1 Tax=Lotharella globosa TaxID=91324 RepID=A0A7S3YYH1_9EUKA
MMHVFEFPKSKPNEVWVVKVQEKAILETQLRNILGGVENANKDKTGLSIWGASVVLARWLCDLRENLKGLTVLELGAGCGLSGLSLGVVGSPKTLTLTDASPDTVENLQHNIELNQGAFGETEVSCCSLQWGDVNKWQESRKDKQKEHQQQEDDDDDAGEQKANARSSSIDTVFDVVIGSDLVYDKEVVPLFVSALKCLLTPKGNFYYTTAVNRAGRAELANLLLKHGFEICNEASHVLSP